MRPTHRAAFVILFGALFLFVALVFDPRLWAIWIAYVVGAAVLGGLDAVWTIPARQISIEWDIPDTLHIGRDETMTVRIQTVQWARSVRGEVLIDLGDLLQSVPVHRIVIAPDLTESIDIVLSPTRRGATVVKRVWLRWTGPMGFTQQITRRDIDHSVAIIPNIRAVRESALRFAIQREYLSGVKAMQYVGDGSEFDSLKEYVPGLDHRAINWRATARHRKLLCQEFRAERDQQVIIALDTGHLMSEPMAGIPKLDHAINAGLLLSYACLHTGDRVGLFGFDSTIRLFREPRGGLRIFPDLQRAATDLTYDDSETNFTLGITELATRLRRRSLIVILTDFVDTITAQLMVENIGRLARRHLIVLVTLRDPTLEHLAKEPPSSLSQLHRSVVATDFISERNAVILRLKKLGVHTLDAPPQGVSVQLLNRYLEIKRRELV